MTAGDPLPINPNKQVAAIVVVSLDGGNHKGCPYTFPAVFP